MKVPSKNYESRKDSNAMGIKPRCLEGSNRKWFREHIVRCLAVAAPVIRFGQMCISSKRGRERETDGRTEIVIFALPRLPPLPSLLLLQHHLLPVVLLLPDRVWDVVSAESRDASVSNLNKNICWLSSRVSYLGASRSVVAAWHLWPRVVAGAQFKTSGQQMESKRRKRASERTNAAMEWS